MKSSINELYIFGLDVNRWLLWDIDDNLIKMKNEMLKWFRNMSG